MEAVVLLKTIDNFELSTQQITIGQVLPAQATS